MKIVAGFLVGFAISFFSFSIYLNSRKTEKKLVLAAQPPPTAMARQATSLTPNPTPSPAPARKVEPSVAGRPTPSYTPTLPPVPTPTPDVWAPADIEPIINRYASVYNIDPNILDRIANCESHFNSIAKNNDYLGMFQFSTNTWISVRTQMHFDANPILRTNIEESIRTAAYLISVRGTRPWPLCLN